MLALIAASAPLWLIVPAALLAGGETTIYNTLLSAALQANLPAHTLGRATAIHRIVQATEVAAAHAPWFERQRDLYAPEVRARIEPGYSIGAETYLRAQRHRRLFTRVFAAAMDGFDAILAPSCPVLAPRIEDEEVTIRGDWSVARPALDPGGWAFEFANVNYPDVDDTAEVVLALRRVDGAGGDGAIDRAVRWGRGMQGSSGRLSRW